MTAYEMALKLMEDGAERKEAEKMMGKKLEDMTKAERLLACQCLAAFEDRIKWA